MANIIMSRLLQTLLWFMVPVCPGLGDGLITLPSKAAATRTNPSVPTAAVLNGTYFGTYNSDYNQDLFLGIPYAQPPVGDLRFRVPQPLDTAWDGTRSATEYGAKCIGYSSPTAGQNSPPVSEDCLSLNVVRPAGTTSDDALPVAIWIHGGGFIEGSSADPKYNLTFIVQRSVEQGRPMVALSINYRLQGWGWLWGEELAAEGSSNVGLRDQRLALAWAQENVAAFGGDPRKVTIWGESAGGTAVGYHLTAYGGRDDGLFRAAIAESGAPTTYYRYQTAGDWEPTYQAVVQAANCSTNGTNLGAGNGSRSTLACLRAVPTAALDGIFNSSVTASALWHSVIDGDMIQESGTTQLREGRFVRVPFLTGGNTDEGTTFCNRGIDTDDEFVGVAVEQTWAVDAGNASVIAELYPDVPALGIPATLHHRPANGSSYGRQYKRSASFSGDMNIHVQRRLANQMWAKYNVSSYSYTFNVLVNGMTEYDGSSHFREVAFVFDDVTGVGYDTATNVNPFAGKPDTFPQLAKMMSSMWVAFVADLEPNVPAVTNVTWPVYSLSDARNLVFDVNVTGLAYVEADTWREEPIQYLSDHLESVFGM